MSTNHSPRPDSGQILHCQYGIFVADAQSSLLAKHPYQRRVRKDSCIRRLWSFRLSADLILSFSGIQTYQSSSTFSLSTVMTLVKSSALSMQRYLIHTSEKLVELWKVLWIPKRFVAEGLEILLYNCSSKRSSGKSGVLCFLKNKWK